jgi:hypothetical protein
VVGRMAVVNAERLHARSTGDHQASRDGRAATSDSPGAPLPR